MVNDIGWLGTQKRWENRKSKELTTMSYENVNLKHRFLQWVIKREESSRGKNCKNGPNSFGLVAVGNN
jgi:hypothetical protein